MVKNMPSNYSSEKKETAVNSGFNGGITGGNSVSNCYSFEHPSLEEIMKFVSATREEIISNPIDSVKMVMHFCKCEDCRRIKEEMMLMDKEFDLALTILK